MVQTPKVSTAFRATLPYQLTSLLALLALAPGVEGFDAQLDSIHERLSPELKRDIELLFLPLGEGLIADRLCSAEPQFDDFASFVGWIANTNPDDVHRACVSLLEGCGGSAEIAKGPNSRGIELPSLEDEAALLAYLHKLPDPWAVRLRESDESLNVMVRLLRSPVEALSRLVFVLSQFWELHGRVLLEACGPTVARCMNYHTREAYEGTAQEIICSVTGQNMLCDESQAQLKRVRHLVFIPSCFIGARALLSMPPCHDQTVFVTFNAQLAGVGGKGQSEVVAQVFPPLKALADETRLHIVSLLRENELYAQQIVDLLEQSQSTISRHLSLLVAGGVLSVRTERGMKFYRINESSMGGLMEQLQSILGGIK